MNQIVIVSVRVAIFVQLLRNVLESQGSGNLEIWESPKLGKTLMEKYIIYSVTIYDVLYTYAQRRLI